MNKDVILDAVYNSILSTALPAEGECAVVMERCLSLREYNTLRQTLRQIFEDRMILEHGGTVADEAYFIVPLQHSFFLVLSDEGREEGQFYLRLVWCR